MEGHVGWVVQVCAILFGASSVLTDRPFQFLQQGMEKSDMERTHGRRIFWKTTLKPEDNDDEDMVTVGSGMDITDHESDLRMGLISCCMLGKLAGETGPRCVMTSHIALKQAGRQSFRTPQRLRWPKTRQLSLVSASIHRCIPGKELEFYKCCYAARSERFEISQWVRLRRIRFV